MTLLVSCFIYMVLYIIIKCRYLERGEGGRVFNLQMLYLHISSLFHYEIFSNEMFSNLRLSAPFIENTNVRVTHCSVMS